MDEHVTASNVYQVNRIEKNKNFREIAKFRFIAWVDFSRTFALINALAIFATEGTTASVRLFLCYFF